MIFFAYVIFVCAISVSDSHAGWVGTCNTVPTISLDCYCATTNVTQSIGPNCSNADTQEQLDNACKAFAGTCPEPIPPSVSINSAEVVKSLNALVTATAAGDGVSERGFFWWNYMQSSGLIPVGYGAGNFSTTLTNLPANTQLYVQSYIKAGGQTITSDNKISITTGSAILPAVITKSDFTLNGGNLLAKGEITDVGSSPVTIYGFVYAAHPGPTVWDMALPFTWDKSLPISQGKAFEGTITGLSEGKYCFRAYAHNSQGTAYGEEICISSLTLKTAGTGKGTVRGGGNFEPGMPVTLTATPDAYSEFAGWSPAPCAASFNMPESALTCTATFNLKTYKLTLETDPTGTGKGTLSGGGNFAAGATVSINAIPDAVSMVKSRGWYPEPCAETFVMPEHDLTCKTAFMAAATKMYEVRLAKTGTGNGTVNFLGLQTSGSFRLGDSLSLEAAPDENSVFAGWSPAPCAARFYMPNNSLTCTATFKLATYNFTVNKAGRGTGKVFIKDTEVQSGKKMTVKSGTKMLIDVYPDDGWKFAGWSPAQCIPENKNDFKFISMPENDLIAVPF